MVTARIARSNRLPDSLPVVLAILEVHPEGITIAELQQEIRARGLWEGGGPQDSKAVYLRIYAILKMLKGKGIIHQTEAKGRETSWVLDPSAYASQRRKELTEALRPFVDGCLMITDPDQLVGQIQEMIQDGTMDAMLMERRARKRRKA